MKIEKKKVATDSKWSTATKSGLAVLMGLSAAATIVACAESGTSAGPEDPESSSESTSPEESENSSSSQVVVDVPKSSSSVDMELLSSSSWQDPPLEAGVIPPYEVIPDDRQSSSSSLDVEPVAGDPAPLPDGYGDESSSSVESSSSSVESSSSEKTDFCDLSPQSPLCPCDSSVQICPDPDDPENMIVSTVTTFERTDIDV